MNDLMELKNGSLENIIIKHNDISQRDTPKPYIETRADGFDYVDEGYMRKVLNENFPVWSWEVKKYEFIGDKAIAVHLSLIHI